MCVCVCGSHENIWILSNWKVFIYMSARGINLYHVEASAANVQRPLVSPRRYLTNENYGLSSGKILRHEHISFLDRLAALSPTTTIYAYQIIERIGLVQPFALFTIYVYDNNSTCSRQYFSKNNDVVLVNSRIFFLSTLGWNGRLK